jgi:hypothetical protein
MDCSSSLAVSSTSSEQTHHLAACPINRNHLSVRRRRSGIGETEAANAVDGDHAKVSRQFGQ